MKEVGGRKGCVAGVWELGMMLEIRSCGEMGVESASVACRVLMDCRPAVLRRFRDALPGETTVHSMQVEVERQHRSTVHHLRAEGDIPQ